MTPTILLGGLLRKSCFFAVGKYEENTMNTEVVNLPASLPALSYKSTTCVIHTEPPARPYGRPIWQTHMADPYGRPIGYMCYTESVKPDLEVFTTFRLHHFQTDERAIAALLLSPPSVIALRPIRIGKLPSSLICAGYMYIYMPCMISID